MKNDEARTVPYTPNENQVQAAMIYSGFKREKIIGIYQVMLDVAPSCDKYAVDIPMQYTKIMDFVREYTENEKQAPTVQEIATAVGRTKGAVSVMMKNMKRHNLIDYMPRHARTIRVL